MPAVKMLNEELLAGYPPGTWVAISQDQDSVVATGTSMNEAIQKAHEKGVLHTFMLRVPEGNSSLIL
jgi:hypothetical protein